MEKTLLNKWLDKLQQESWQLELLISGFAIFGLFSLKNYMTREMELFYSNMHGELSLQLSYGMLVVVLLVTHIFIVNLLIHIMVRGLLIGAIGLRYVSGDIDYDKLKYNDRFIKYYKRTVGSFDNYIFQLEKISSVIFSFTFLLFFVFISFFLFFVATVIISFILIELGFDQTYEFVQILNIIWLFLFGLVAFDFITLGLIRKIKQRHFSKFYLVLYKVVGVITLSFLWRALLLNFLDQKFTKRLLIAIVPYIITITLLIPNSHIYEFEYFPKIYSTPLNGQFDMSSKSVNANSFNSQFYDSMRASDDPDFTLIQTLSLPSNRVSGNILEVFAKYTINSERYIEHQDSGLYALGEVGYYNNVLGSSDFSTKADKEKKNLFKKCLIEKGKDLSPKRKKEIKDSLYNVFNNQDEVAFSKNLLKIKRLIKEGISFYIDDQLIPDSIVSMDFYKLE